LNKLDDKVKLYLVEDGENTEVSSIQMNNFRGNSITFPSVASLQGSQYDLVVANILAPILLYLAETLAVHTKPGGKIALSGLVYQQQEAIIKTYSKYFTNVKVEAMENDWILVTGDKPSTL
jgi:ribosomal protein L11 methyltransferase